MQYSKRKIFLVRHGETEWSLSGKHTGKTDLALTENGREQAVRLGHKIKGHAFEKILVSPLKRAMETCELAGLLKNAHVDSDLEEWDYGAYEGLKTEEIWKIEPQWNIFLRGAPKGESVEDIGGRINRVLVKINASHGDIAIFSHGHFLRALAARWLHLPIANGQSFYLSPGSLSTLSYERNHPVLSLWNESNH